MDGFDIVGWLLLAAALLAFGGHGFWTTTRGLSRQRDTATRYLDTEGFERRLERDYPHLVKRGRCP